jgi:hypothetical protein
MSDVPARMSLEEAKPITDHLSQFEADMWFLAVFPDREQAAIRLAYDYAKMGQPGLPSHLYLKVIHTLSELLRQVDVELVDDGQD